MRSNAAVPVCHKPHCSGNTRPTCFTAAQWAACSRAILLTLATGGYINTQHVTGADSPNKAMLLASLCFLSTLCLLLSGKKDDPLAGVKKSKIGKELKAHLREYDGEQIAALGSSNSKACKHLKLTHFGGDSAFLTKFRNHVSFECAKAIYKNHQDAFDALFKGASEKERTKFLQRLGKDKVCAKSGLFSGSNLATTVGVFCGEAAKGKEEGETDAKAAKKAAKKAKKAEKKAAKKAKKEAKKAAKNEAKGKKAAEKAGEEAKGKEAKGDEAKEKSRKRSSTSESETDEELVTSRTKRQATGEEEAAQNSAAVSMGPLTGLLIAGLLFVP